MRKGFYDITIEHEIVIGFDDKENEVTEKKTTRLRGHFSVNFWTYIEKAYGKSGLSEVLELFSGSLSLDRFRDMVYFSHMAYTSDKPDGFRKFNGKDECGHLIEHMNSEQWNAVTEAFTQSQVISELIGSSEDTEKK